MATKEQKETIQNEVLQRSYWELQEGFVTWLRDEAEWRACQSMEPDHAIETILKLDPEWIQKYLNGFELKLVEKSS